MEAGHVDGHLKENSGPNLGGTLCSNKHVHSFSSSSSSSSYSSSTMGSDFGDEKNQLSGPELISLQNTPQSSTAASAPLDKKIGMHNSPPELSPMKSPPVQTMGQAPGYDPNRIPLSIFSVKGANTAEWSATSNESLFSLRMGNNSFSTDYAILYGKSGELTRSDDWNHLPPNPLKASGELPRLDAWSKNAQSNPCQTSDQAKSDDLSSLPPAVKVPSEKESSLSSDELLGIENNDDSKCPKLAPVASVESNTKEKPVTDEAVNISATAAAAAKISLESDTKEKPVTDEAVNISAAAAAAKISLESDTKEKPVADQTVHIPDAAAAKISIESDAKENPVTDQVVNGPGNADAKKTDANNAMPEAAPPAPSVSPNFPSPPRCSGESGNSGNSFAFPVLVNGSGKKACSLKSVTEKPEEPQSQPEVAEEAPAKSKRFSCFSCFPQCC